MPPIKLLFLDFDGVIRLGDDDGKNPRFDPACVDRVLRIVEETGCKIVVSSDLVSRPDVVGNWSLSFMLVQINDQTGTPRRDAFEQALFSTWTFPNPSLYMGESRRARMILDFANGCRPGTAYAILDDQEKLFQGPYGISLKGALVLTNNRHGIQNADAARVVAILGKREDADHEKVPEPLGCPPADGMPDFSPETTVAPKSASEMTFAFGDELDKLVNRFCDEWDVPVSIILGCLYHKAVSISIHHAKQNDE